MNYYTTLVFSFSILIASIIGGIRFKKINPVYYPFLYCTWVGLLNEIVSFVLIKKGITSAFNNNIYVLFESLLLLWQFRNWGSFKRHEFLFTTLVALFIIGWTIENFFISTIIHFTFYYRIFYSFVLVLMSIHTINGLIMTERRNIFKNSIFLLCIGFVIYFTFKVLVESFWLYGLNVSKEFSANIVIILLNVNLFVNLVYALAVLWMPTKHRFILPY